MKYKSILVLINILILFSFTFSQELKPYEKDRLIEFPDIPGYKTLKCDFHQHTAFSDGHVWPDIRTMEAQRDGLDAIAITDHLEYRPHKDDLPNINKNRAFEIAKKESGKSDLIVINGAEVTRDMPPGHINAIFLTDVNKLMVDDSIDALKEAEKQDAFVFWNHPHWVAHKPDGMAEMMDMHRMLIKEGLIKGIEIVNEYTYSDEALQIALENNLTIMGSSDVHGLVDWDFKLAEGGHRPVTLVFAKEKSEMGIKEALNSGRTAVWFDNFLIGRSEYITPLLEQSLVVKKREALTSHKGESLVTSVYIENISDADMILENMNDYTLHSHADIFTVKAHDTEVVQVKTLKILPEFDLSFRVLNAVIAPKTHPVISLKIK
jgi:hypothetical protein